jgi:hypothetical protein
MTQSKKLFLPLLLVSAGLTACGGAIVGSDPAVTTPVATEKNLARASSAELVAFYQEKLRSRVASGKSQGAIDLSPQPVFSNAPTGVDASLSVSGTNNQEAGVDEEDLIKSDGSLFFTLEQSRESVTSVFKPKVAVYQRAADGSIAQTNSQTLGESQQAIGLHYAPTAKKLVVMGMQSQAFPAVGGTAVNSSLALRPIGFYNYKPRMAMQFHTASSVIPQTARWDIDGTLIASRLVGSTVYLAISYTPTLAVDSLSPTTPDKDREAAIAAVTAKDLLPSITIDGQTTPLLTEQDCYLQRKNASTDLGLTVLLAVNLDTAIPTRTARCFVGGTEGVYMTPTSLYLASTRQDYRLAADTVYPPEMFTDIHKFSVAANDFNYKGSGTVNGHLGWSQELKSSRLSEYQSDLRVITFTGQSTGWFGAPIATSDQTLKTASPAKLTVMREGKDADGTAALQVISTLPSATRPDNIGKVGEQIYGVRFFANKAYVVTFRRTDPLYVLDLTNASDPKVAGALEVPGFSDYLLPVGDSLLFGIGKDANAQGRATGVKVALYDVSNPAFPVEVSKKVYGNSGSASGIDYSSHGLNLLQKGNITRLTLPMVLNQTDPTISASSNLSKGLYRFEINSTAKTLVEKTPVGQQVFDKNDINSYVFYNLNNDRALQVNDLVYYLRPDGLKVFAW